MLSPWSYNILCLSWMDWWMQCWCQPREDKQLGWSLEGNEQRIWSIFTIQTFFTSPCGKDVPCLGWKSLTLSLLLINQWGTCKNKSRHTCLSHKLGVWCKHGQSWRSSIHNGWSQCVHTIVYSFNIFLWHQNNPSNFHAFLLWAHRAMERPHVTLRFTFHMQGEYGGSYNFS